MKHFALIAAAVVVSTVLVTCAPDAVSHGGPVRDYVSLVDSLRAIGARVDPVGTVSQPFFSVQGQLIAVDSAQVQVFEYGSANAAQSEATRISADGSAIGTSKPSWVAPPHFYRKEKLIVLYVGSDAHVLGLLTQVLGAQIAGR